MIKNLLHAVTVLCAISLARLGSAQVVNAPVPQTFTTPAAGAPSIALSIPHSRNPLDAYRPVYVAAPNLANSARLDTLVHNGILELSLHDAIALALENNLDLLIQRYNIPIAKADVLRTRAGGVFRGVNTGIVQNTPGAGVGGFGSGTSGAGAGGTSGGAGGAGTGASGLVQSTLGTGTNVNSYDPNISGDFGYQHSTQPLSNLQTFGVQTLKTDEVSGDVFYTQAFPIGTTLQVGYTTFRAVDNSPNSFLNPQLQSTLNIQARQRLLAGRGFGPNLRFLRIARNNQKISDQAFELQVISTVTQIANIYWDLVAAYEDEEVKQNSLGFAQQTLESGRKQLALQAIPALDVLKDEAEVANREGDLTVAKSQLQFQELLIKNALTKNLDDPILEAMPVKPLDRSSISQAAATTATEDLVTAALGRRVELAESAIDLENRRISNSAARNALLPSVDLVATYGGSGLAGTTTSTTVASTAPTNFGGAFANSFNNSAPNYFVGLSVNVPIRNRVAKSDQYRSELESRQAQVREQQLRKQIRIEVRNAQYTLDQSLARVVAAEKAKDLAARLFTISGKEQELGAGSALQTLGARRDQATAESTLVTARTAAQKARVELDRATGQTLAEYAISIDAARRGASE